MLQLVVDPPDGRWSYQKSLIDEDRQIVFAPLGTLARGTADAFRLTWGNRVIPVSASTCEYQDENGQRFLVLNSIAVNGAGIELVYGVKSYLIRIRSGVEHSSRHCCGMRCGLRRTCPRIQSNYGLW